MTKRRFCRPYLEVLEDRTCPALTIKATGADLFIFGTPSTSAAGLQITGVGTNRYQLKDGASSLGIFPIARNLHFHLHHYTSKITVDLQASSFAGNHIGSNVLLNVGSGNISGASQPIVIRDGTVGGSVQLNGGRGNERLELGVAGGTEALRIGGNVTVVGRNGTATGNNNEFVLFDTSSIGGALSTTLFYSVQIGETGGTGVTVGNMSVNASTVAVPLAMTINSATVFGNLSVVGTGLGGTGDILQVDNASTVHGNTVANLGDNLNDWQLGGTFHGDVTILGGSGIEPGGVALNTIQLQLAGGNGGTFDGSVRATTGSGSTALVFPSTATVSGDLFLTFGNGENDLGGGVFGGDYEGKVSGNAAITLGNGTNFVSVETAPGGKLQLRSGNGTNTHNLAPAVATHFLVDMVLGTGTNTLTLNGSTTLSGRVRGTGGANTFMQGGATLQPELLFINFP